MDDRSVQSELLPTAFVSSFIGRARDGDLHDPDLARRASAWARWAVDNLTQMTGLYDRNYAALRLPGKFYDPKGTGPKVRPHLEVSTRTLSRPSPEFPDRLALIGNGLLFPWWVMSEVTAVRRSLFNVLRGDVADAVDLFCARRGALTDVVAALASQAQPAWQVVERLLVSSPDGLAEDAAGDFDAAAVAEFFPAAAELNLEVAYDAKLRESNGPWASRRVGVWQVRGVNTEGDRFSFGVITPRLTANSLFRDPLFRPSRESAAALLVRGLLLRRLVDRHLQVGASSTATVSDRLDDHALTGPGRPYLRAVPARTGHKLPQASVESCAHFLQTYPDADQAWKVLTDWAGSSYLLTVTEPGFRASHSNALRLLRRAETPVREDVDVLLPLAWDVGGPESRVVRVTFTRPKGDSDE